MPGLDTRIADAIQRERLVATAIELVSIPSFTGEEEACAQRMRAILAEECGMAVQWQQVEEGRANVLGRARGQRRRHEPDVQRPHGHVVVRPRALAAGHPGPAARGVRAGRAHLRPRHLEHEGRAGVLRRGRARPGRRRRGACAATCSSPPSRARSRRRSRATRRAPSTAATRPARAISCGTAAWPTSASSASRPSSSSCSATSARSGRASRPAARTSTRRSARAGAARTRSCACARCSTRSCSGSRGGSRPTPTAARTRSSTSARCRAASAGASRARRTAPTSSSTCGCRPRSR